MKTKETIGKLDESISIIEKQTLENKRQFEKLMSAEITQRYSKQRIGLTVVKLFVLMLKTEQCTQYIKCSD